MIEIKNIFWSKMKPQFGFSFPAIRGIQAGKEYYISMCPINMLSKIFDSAASQEIGPELRAQRLINKSRIPVLKRYIINNPENYIFSSLTASIDGETEFIPLVEDKAAQMGTLKVAMNARFIINDGQHRRAAIAAALKEDENIGYETISIVFFLDMGLEKSQQMFADLNRYAAKPSASLNVLYDSRDPLALLVKEFAITSQFYNDLIEMERTSLSSRSKKLFTLSAFYFATQELISNWDSDSDKNDKRKKQFIFSFWEDLALQFKEWQEVKEEKISSGEVRNLFLHTYGVMLQAFGRIGNNLVDQSGENRMKYLSKLKKIDWQRSNTKLWEGRIMVGGKVMKNRQNIILASNVIKKKLKLNFTEEELNLEKAFLKKENHE